VITTTFSRIGKRDVCRQVWNSLLEERACLLLPSLQSASAIPLTFESPITALFSTSGSNTLYSLTISKEFRRRKKKRKKRKEKKNPNHDHALRAYEYVHITRANCALVISIGDGMPAGGAHPD